MRNLGKGETSEPIISCTKTRKSSERGRDGEGKEEKRKRKEKKGTHLVRRKGDESEKGLAVTIPQKQDPLSSQPSAGLQFFQLKLFCCDWRPGRTK